MSDFKNNYTDGARDGRYTASMSAKTKTVGLAKVHLTAHKKTTAFFKTVLGVGTSNMTETEKVPAVQLHSSYESKATASCKAHQEPANSIDTGGSMNASRPRSPTEVAHAYSDMKPVAQSSRYEIKTPPDLTGCTGARPKLKTQQTSDKELKRIETDAEKGQAIRIQIQYYSKDNIKRKLTVNRPSTPEAYMRWKYIMQSRNYFFKLFSTLQEQLSVKIEWKQGEDLVILSPLDDTTCLDCVCDEVVKVSLELGGLCVQSVKTQSHNLKLFMQRIERSNFYMMKALYCQNFGDHLFVVYIETKKEIEEFVKNLNNMCSRLVALDPALFDLLRSVDLTRILKGSSNSTDLVVDIAMLETKQPVCHLFGPESELELATRNLDQLCESVIDRNCQLMILHTLALRELQVEQFINEQLRNNDIDCIAKRSKDKITIYGFDLNTVQKGCELVGSFLVEKQCLLLGEDRTMSESIISQIIRSFEGKVVVYTEVNSTKLFVIGIKEYVDKALEIVNNRARRNNRGKDEELTCNTEYIAYEVKDIEKYEYFWSCKLFSEWGQLHKFTVSFDIQQGKYLMNISGSKEAVKQIKMLIEATEGQLKYLTAHSNDLKTCKFFSSADGNLLLKECSIKKDVIINQKVCQKSNGILITDQISVKPNGKTKQSKCWVSEHRTNIHLLAKGSETTGITAEYVDVKFQLWTKGEEALTIIQTSKGYHAVVRVPAWVDGQKQERQTLEVHLKKLMSDVEKGKTQRTLILPTDPPSKWPSPEFSESVISTAVGHVVDTHTQFIKAIYLVVSDDQDFESTAKQIQRLFKSYSRVLKGKNKLQGFIKDGELSKMEVDAVVNTTSRKLDLSHGKVSSSLLTAAGKQLQLECNSKYPSGISYMDVAVTDAFLLPCKMVFHIALEKYDSMREPELLQRIKVLVYACLDKACQLGLKSIAFPALGTGVLKYPVELVAAAMFEGLELFRAKHPDTSLERALFVIFYTDTSVMEVFKKQAETVDASKETNQAEINSALEVKIYGVSENSQHVKNVLLDKFKEFQIDIHENVSQEFADITRTDFAVLGNLFAGDIVNLDASITHEGNCLKLTGKRKHLKGATQKMNTILKDYRENWSVDTLSTQIYESQEVEQEVDKVKQKKKAVYCMYDKTNDIVCVYGKSRKYVKKVSAKIKENLDKKCQMKMKDAIPSSKSEQHASEQTVQLKGSEQACAKYNSKNENACQKSDTDTMQTKETQPIGNIVVRSATDQVAFEKTMQPKPNLQNTPKLGARTYKSARCVVYVYHGDILKTPVECIVNPVRVKDNGVTINYTIELDLTELLQVIRTKEKPLSVASVISTACNGPFKFILHAFGPCWDENMTPTKSEKVQANLKATVINCFVEAERLKVASVAVKIGSFALFGIPKEICAIKFAEAVLDSGRFNILREIHFIDDTDEMVQLAQQYFTKMIEESSTPNVYEGALGASSKDVTHEDNLIKGAGKRTCRDKPIRNNLVGDKQETTRDVDKVVEVVNCTEVDRFLICSFSNRFTVLIYEDNIFELKEIDAIVCIDDRLNRAPGICSQLLFTKGGAKNKTESDNQTSLQTDFGEIVKVSGVDPKFKFIFYVSVTGRDQDAVRQIYKSIFDEAVKRKEIGSIALTIHGASTADFSVEMKTALLFTEWTKSCKRNTDIDNKLTLHIVLKGQGLANDVKRIFKALINGSSGIKEERPDYSKTSGTDLRDDSNTSSADKDEKSNAKEAERSAEKVIDDCVICMDHVKNEKVLKCGHKFCKDCIEGYFRVKMACPTCGKVCGVIYGDQPDGVMEIFKNNHRLEGYASFHTIGITYRFEDGTQWPEHPRPGTPYRGIQRTAYLPDNQEGREICAMLAFAFDRRLVFTIGTSRTTGKEGVITWNDIHHKTNPKPNTQFGYPDATYLQRVRDELEAKGVKKDDVNDKLLNDLEDPYFGCIIRSDSRV